MKVLLVNCPISERFPPFTLPLGMAYLIAVLRKANHKVEVLDINGFRYDRSEVENKIRELNYDMVCTGGVITLYKYLKFLTPVLKKYHPDKPIVIGGNISNEIPHLLFKYTSSDILMIGEAEVTVCELADALEKTGIIVNKNTVPKETRSPFVTSGIRIGTPALTTKGMKEKEMKLIGAWIADVLDDVKNETKIAAIKKNVIELSKSFPMYR